MRDAHTVRLPQDAYEELQRLSQTLGFPPELAAVYAIRLVSACIREGLLTDVPGRAWPQEAHLQSVAGGAQVIAFPGKAQKKRLRRKTGDGQ